MAGASTVSVAIAKYRVAFWSLGLLLTVAIALNIVALSSTNWVKDDDASIPSAIPTAVLRSSPSGGADLSQAELNPTSPDGFAVYQGMRAGAFSFCFTLADTSAATTLVKETCTPYRSKKLYAFVGHSDGIPSTYVYSIPLKMCGSNPAPTFKRIGIPSSLVPAFLDSFCGVEGYLVIIFQLGAILTAATAWAAWLARATTGKDANRGFTALATCVAALLSLATFILWVGALTPSVDGAAVSLGASAYCTISATVLLAAAALVARFGPRGEEPVEELPPTTMEPLV